MAQALPSVGGCGGFRVLQHGFNVAAVRACPPRACRRLSCHCIPFILTASALALRERRATAASGLAAWLAERPTKFENVTGGAVSSAAGTSALATTASGITRSTYFLGRHPLVRACPITVERRGTSVPPPYWRARPTRKSSGPARRCGLPNPSTGSCTLSVYSRRLHGIFPSSQYCLNQRRRRPEVVELLSCLLAPSAAAATRFSTRSSGLTVCLACGRRGFPTTPGVASFLPWISLCCQS